MFSPKGPRPTLGRRDCAVTRHPTAETGISDFKQLQRRPIREPESTLAPGFCQFTPPYSQSAKRETDVVWSARTSRFIAAVCSGPNPSRVCESAKPIPDSSPNHQPDGCSPSRGQYGALNLLNRQSIDCRETQRYLLPSVAAVSAVKYLPLLATLNIWYKQRNSVEN